MSRSVEMLTDILRDESAVPSSTEILANLPGRIRRHRLRTRAVWSVGATVTAILVTASVLVGLHLPRQSSAHWPFRAPTLVEVSKPDVSVAVFDLSPDHLLASV